MRAARNRNFGRAVASVVWPSVSTLASSSRLNNISQHGELKVNAVHRPPPRRMSRQTSIIFCFLNEVLRARALIVEPRQESDPTAYVRDEYAIAVFRRVEQ